MHTTSTYLQELHKSDASSKRSRDKIVSLYRKMVEKGENKGGEYFRSILRKLDNGNLDHY